MKLGKGGLERLGFLQQNKKARVLGKVLLLLLFDRSVYQ